MPGAQLAVDLAAVAENTALVAGRTSGEVMAVVKADGFGHGAAAVARTALTHGATRLGVTGLDEAFSLRDAGLLAPVLSWLNPLDADWDRALRLGVEIAVPGVDHLDAVATASWRTDRPARVHLHADVGLARDGAAPQEWAALCERARLFERQGTVEVVGLMGHLALADEGPDTAGRARFARFTEVARRQGLTPRRRHLAATAATLTDPASHLDIVRIGAGLVGIDPSGTTALRNALTLTAPVVSVREVRAGTGVGYGHTWTAPRRTTLALLPLGYADGLPVAASNRGEVSLLGRRCRIAGRISMDQVVVDVGDRPVRAGDVATVFGGDGPTVAEWAWWGATLPHDVVTGLGPRIVRTTAAPALALRSVS